MLGKSHAEGFTDVSTAASIALHSAVPSFFRQILNSEVAYGYGVSDRTLTLRLNGMNAVPEIAGVKNDWHNLSHHGQDEAKIEELKVIELAEYATFAEFLTKLKTTQDNGRPLLDSTSVLFGSNLGNASAHQTANLPIILVGGGYKHGRHIAIDKEKHVFANLFVSIAQRMGVEADQFGFSTGVLDINQA